MFAAAVLVAVWVPSVVFVPLIWSLTEPAAATTAFWPSSAGGPPVGSGVPSVASEGAAATRPVFTPAETSAESTAMVTPVPDRVVFWPGSIVLGAAAPVTGMANVENVPVTPRQPLF